MIQCRTKGDRLDTLEYSTTIRRAVRALARLGLPKPGKPGKLFASLRTLTNGKLKVD